MERSLRAVWRAIQRWAVREEKALTRQFHGKTASDRFDGLGRSARNEAKFFLLIIGPAALAGPFIGKWSDATPLGKAVWLLLILWSVAVLVGGGFLLFRALLRASRHRSG
jgi:hypothetical protein